MQCIRVVGPAFPLMQQLYDKSGAEGLKIMRDNLSKMKIFSLFSGLGGAELSIQQLYLACKALCEKVGLEPPSMPENLLSCDYDPTCQQVLLNHHHPSKYVIDDMLRFVSPRCRLA